MKDHSGNHIATLWKQCWQCYFSGLLQPWLCQRGNPANLFKPLMAGCSLERTKEDWSSLYTHTHTHTHKRVYDPPLFQSEKAWLMEITDCSVEVKVEDVKPMPFSLSSLSLLLASNWPLEVVIKTGWLVKHRGRLICQMEVFPDWSRCRLPVYGDLGPALPTLSLRSDQSAKKSTEDSPSWSYGEKWMLGSPDAARASVWWLQYKREMRKRCGMIFCICFGWLCNRCHPLSLSFSSS